MGSKITAISAQPESDHPLLLSTEEDFSLIIEALDIYAYQAGSLYSTMEISNVAIEEAKKIDPEVILTDKEFQALVDKKVDKNKIKEEMNRIRDKVILLKAKVLMTKDHLRKERLDDEIQNLLDGHA